MSPQPTSPKTGVSVIARSETLAQRAYEALRQAIRTGSMEHERVYSESELAQSMGVSRTPVREALLELSRDGLVEILPQRGFRLRSLSHAEREEIYGLRMALEGYVVERLAMRGDPQHVAALRQLLDGQRRVLEEDPAGFLTIDEQFHLLMPELLQLARAHQMLVTLRGAMWLTGSLALSIGERAPHVLEEHTAIVDAIAARDPRAARRAIREHLDASLQAVELELELEANAAGGQTERSQPAST
ncbi:GntR family transcriptional regulator [Conexibacter woesei]|uniref:Transcriptional regulator, GntR family n=1 Tax=Conexibacter woesei (strain DSM 14684 / CCUG 47730 / CIP 108061 / JCM 11494 / NBRC 100937 / ID131577) TaxID=469383 RepID=D3F6Y2_CONWI|nr:GntR family transcriptional regulator [Conexibacter woesei]ADB52780.1 transcriptional regulator, GntR family [Conexibacter woesei DSM 14684]